ncbi:hypothetical protein I3760_08G134300 [Carya illinoinensis]|nr:hypothetical protein I3760_08G134300 [Carya illinoinensis]
MCLVEFQHNHTVSHHVWLVQECPNLILHCTQQRSMVGDATVRWLKKSKLLFIKTAPKNFIYLGDGNGDYCPTLKLGEGDYVTPRKNYPMWKHFVNDC